MLGDGSSNEITVKLDGIRLASGIDDGEDDEDEVDWDDEEETSQDTSPQTGDPFTSAQAVMMAICLGFIALTILMKKSHYTKG